jgi:hypothetical protein
MAGYTQKVPGKTLEQQTNRLVDQAAHYRELADGLRQMVREYRYLRSRVELVELEKQAEGYDEAALDLLAQAFENEPAGPFRDYIGRRLGVLIRESGDRHLRASDETYDGLDGDEIYSGRGPVDVYLDRAQITQGFADKLRDKASYYGSREYARRIGSGALADAHRDAALREAAEWQMETDHAMEAALQIEARIAAGTY